MTRAAHAARFARAAAPALAALVFFTALALAMFAPIVFGRQWFVWDVPDQYWADLRYLCDSLHRGHWPLWNPYDRGGYPFHADPQSGLHYPLNWAACALAGRAPGLGWAEARVVFHFVLAGGAMTGFLRALGLAWGPAVLGGAAFMMAPYQRRMWGLNLTYTIAYLPAVLWAIERLAREPGARRAAVLALVVALATSVGSPPSLYFIVLTSTAYALARCGPRRATWSWLALAGALAGAMCAAMVLPGGEMARHSVQHGRDYASISAGGYALREAAGLVWPRNKYLYVGLPLAALALYGALARRSPLDRAQRICFAALAVLATAMTFGDHSFVYRAMYRALPGVSAFRSPVRYSAILGAAVAVLAAAGAAALPRARIFAWAALPVVIASLWPGLPPDREARGGSLPGGPAQWATVSRRVGEVRSAWRVWDEFALGLRAGTRYGVRDFRGYQDPLLMARYERVIDDLREYPRLLEQYNVRYLLRGPHYIHGTGHHFLPAGAERSFAQELGDGVWETHAPLAAAYWVERAEVLASPVAVIERLRRDAPVMACLLEAGDGAIADRGAGPGATVAATRVTNHRDTVEVLVNAPARGWLVLNETYYPGWTARIDGREVPVRRANYLVRAVEVPAGAHTVVFAYAPQGYRWSALLALAACVASVALCFKAPRRAEPELRPRG